MAQRGGSVISTVRYGKQVWSPVSPRADIVIATELLEGRRALGLLADKGALVYATTTIAPGGVLRGEKAYPDDLLEAAGARLIQLVAVDAEGLARKAGTVRAANVALLGAATHVLPFGSRAWEQSLEWAVPGQDPRGQPTRVRPGPRGGRSHSRRDMKVTQVTVFLENRSGRLAEIADILGRAGRQHPRLLDHRGRRVRHRAPDRARPGRRPRDPPQGGLHDPPLAGDLRGGARRARRSCPRARRARRAEDLGRLPLQHLVQQRLFRGARRRPRRRAARPARSRCSPTSR